MAVYYSTEYARLYVPPIVRTQACRVYGVTYTLPFEYINPASGGAEVLGDIVYLCKVPPVCEILMTASFCSFSAWDTGATLDIGWLAYTRADETPVVADDNALLDGLALQPAGAWAGGALRTGTTTFTRKEPVVNRYSVRASDFVTLTATFRTTAPTASDTFEGYITVLVD